MSKFAGTDWTTQRVTVADGESDSEVIAYRSFSRIAVLIPADAEGDSIVFLGSEDKDGTYNEILDESGSNITVSVTKDQIMVLDQSFEKILPVPWLKIQMQTTGTAEAQSGDVELIVLLT